MSTLAKILGRYAPGHVIQHANRDYTFNVIAPAQRVAIQKAWYQRLRAQLKEFHDDGEYDAAEYQRLLGELREKYMAGEYDLAGKGGQMMGACYDGQLLLVRHITGATPEEAESLVQARLVEVKEIIGVVFMESFPDLKQRALAMEKEQEKEKEREQDSGNAE